MATGQTGGTQVVVRGKNRALAVHRQALVAVRGPDAGKRWVVDAPHAVVGSGAGADVTLQDDTVSGRHCELSVREERYVLRDLRSTNGTLVNGVEVVEAYVEHGSRLQLGETELRFEPELQWVLMPDGEASSFGTLVGNSPAMQRIYSVLNCVAPTRLTVLFQGETGTGKEVAARSLHEESDRRAGPFVVLDCGAISASLIEAELFGHEQGAFTGAERARAGCFELANGGTVLIDEIGELPLDLQPKLLGVIERREVRRIGGRATIDVDVRVAAATHRDLAELVEAGTFREDLYYRLAEVIVDLPPLAERSSDIPVLAANIIKQETARTGRLHRLSPDAQGWLVQRVFPGNVRELRSLLRRALALSENPVIGPQDLLEAERIGGHGYKASDVIATDGIPVGDDGPIKRAREQWHERLEPRYLRCLMERFGDDLDRAASHAGLHRKSLMRLLKQYGLQRPD